MEQRGAIRRWVVPCFLLAGLLASAFPSGTSGQAFPRLVLAAVVVLILPGWGVLERLDWFGIAREWDERILMAFAGSYVIVSGLCVVVTLQQLNIIWGVGLLFGLIVVTWFFGFRGTPRDATEAGTGEETARSETAKRGGGSWEIWFVVGPLAALVLWFTWVIEPRIMGEEVVELITIRKILENPVITLTNLLHTPEAIPTYIFTPYYFMVALVTKLSGLPLFAAYVKLRIVYVGMALLAFFALCRRLVGSAPAAALALAGLLLLLVVDPDPWFWPASLFPLNRRGAFTEGILLPITALVTLGCLSGRIKRRTWAFLSFPFFILSLVMTHTLEVVHLLFFWGSLFVAGVIIPQLRLARGRVAILLFLAMGILLGYRWLHRETVHHVVAYEAARQTVDRQELKALLKEPARALFGGVTAEARYPIVAAGGVAVYSMFPQIISGIGILAKDQWGGILWGALTFPMLLYAIPLFMKAMIHLTTNEIVFVSGYFSLFGLMSFLLLLLSGCSVGERYLLREGRIPGIWRLLLTSLGAVLVGGIVFFPVCRWLMDLVVRFPALPAIGGVVGGAVCLVARRFLRMRFPSPAEIRRPAVVAIPFLCLLIPLFLGMKTFPGKISGSERRSMWEELRARRTIPSVLNWDAYYPLFQHWTNPPVDLPWEIVEDLRRVIPPAQIVAYDPDHSYTIPLLLNQYIVNPGHVMSTDMEYFRRFVKQGKKDGERIHPIFNEVYWTITRDEWRFLEEYRVRYLLVNPRYALLVNAKIREFPDRFRLMYEREGYSLYEVVEDPPGGRSPENKN